MNQRSDFFAAGCHRRNGTVAVARQLDRAAGRVDVAAVAEPVGDFERGVAERPCEPIAHRHPRLCSQLDDELGCFRATQARPEDPRHDPHRERHGNCPHDRLELRHARVRRDHPPQPHETRQDGGRRCGQKRSLRAACRPAQGAQPLQDEEKHDQSNGKPGDLLHSIDSVGDARPRSDRQQAASVRNDERADNLPAERHYEGAGDRELDRARPGPPFREGEHEESQ